MTAQPSYGEVEPNEWFQPVILSPETYGDFVHSLDAALAELEVRHAGKDQLWHVRTTSAGPNKPR